MSTSLSAVRAARAVTPVARALAGRRWSSTDAEQSVGQQEKGKEPQYPSIEAIRASAEAEVRGSGRSKEISRDMGSEAESSRSPRRPATSLEQQLYGNRTTSPSKQHKAFPRSISITDSLTPAWRNNQLDLEEARRPARGVHDRFRRTQGTTPAEATTLNELMAEMLHTAPISKSHPGRARNEAYTTSLRSYGGPPPPLTGSHGGRIHPRMLERLETEEDHAVIEELDSMKEEIGLLQTDVDLLKWAKKRVFAPIGATPSLDPAKAKTAISEGDAGPTYPPVYSRILAYLLGYVRRNYNNPHLVLALFHHAQTQSPESYLSGCLAGAYNEVIKTRWESFRDLEGVEAAVREMEANGVAWDRGIAKTMGKIVDEVSKEVFEGVRSKEIYGEGVETRLLRLEDRLQKDINMQTRMYEAKQREKQEQRNRAAQSEEFREGQLRRASDERMWRDAVQST